MITEMTSQLVAYKREKTFSQNIDEKTKLKNEIRPFN